MRPAAEWGYRGESASVQISQRPAPWLSEGQWRPRAYLRHVDRGGILKHAIQRDRQPEVEVENHRHRFYSQVIVNQCGRLIGEKAGQDSGSCARSETAAFAPTADQAKQKDDVGDDEP